MSPEQRQLIKAFVDNKPMFNAVRAVLLQGILGDNFAEENWVFAIDAKQTDAAYGRQVKLTAKAMQWLKRAFDDLPRLASSNPQHTSVNEAR